jgi:hypothetical protein
VRGMKLGAALALSVLWSASGPAVVGAEAGTTEPRRAVIYSGQPWKTLWEEPSDEQIQVADHQKMVVDTRTPGALVFSVKMADVSDSGPGEAGFHAAYTVDFTTVDRQGNAPVHGRLFASTYYDYFSSRTEDEIGREPCAGAVTIDPESPWVTFTMSKRCFRGKGRTMTRYSVETRSYHHVVRDDGVVDDTEDVAIDETSPRRLTALRLR